MSAQIPVWAVTFSFYTAQICGGTITLNILSRSGLGAIELARKCHEEHHGTKFVNFDVEKLEKICDVVQP